MLSQISKLLDRYTKRNREESQSDVKAYERRFLDLLALSKGAFEKLTLVDSSQREEFFYALTKAKETCLVCLDDAADKRRAALLYIDGRPLASYYGSRIEGTLAFGNEAHELFTKSLKSPGALLQLVTVNNNLALCLSGLLRGFRTSLMICSTKEESYFSSIKGQLEMERAFGSVIAIRNDCCRAVMHFVDGEVIAVNFVSREPSIEVEFPNNPTSEFYRADALQIFLPLYEKTYFKNGSLRYQMADLENRLIYVDPLKNREDTQMLNCS